MKSESVAGSKGVLLGDITYPAEENVRSSDVSDAGTASTHFATFCSIGKVEAFELN